MIKERILIGLVTAGMLFASGSAGTKEPDLKIKSLLNHEDLFAGQEKEEEGKNPSAKITFTDDFESYRSGDVIGHIKTEYSLIDSDVILTASGAEAEEMAKKDPKSVYLIYAEEGTALNANYINLYADESIMMTSEDMDYLAKVKKKRLVHCWITVGDEELQMDLMGAYYASDASGTNGQLRVLTEEMFLPDGLADSQKVNYVTECVNNLPKEAKCRKMLTISSYGDTEKRMFVFVNQK